MKKSVIKKFRLGGWSLLLTAAVIAAAALLNLAAGRLDEAYYLKADLSSDQLSSVSEETRQTLEALKEDVYFYTVYKTGTVSSLRTLTEETLAIYRSVSDHVIVENIDPATEPHRLSILNTAGVTVDEGTVFAANADQSRICRIDADSFLYSRTLNGTVYSLYIGEIRFTGALLNVTVEDIPRVYFLTGHGETAMEACASAALQLSAIGYAVSELDLNEAAPSGSDVLLVLSPTTDLTDAELRLLVTWLDGGGRLLIAYDAFTEQGKLKNFALLLDLYGLGFQQGYVVEDADNTGNWVDKPDFIKPLVSGTSSVASLLTQRLILPCCCAVSVPGIRSGISTEEILWTSEEAYRKAGSAEALYTFEKGDVSGKQILALSADGGEGWRILQIASARMILDETGSTGVNLLNASGNLEFFASCANWLAEREDLIASADVKTVPTNLIEFPDQARQRQVSVLILGVLPTLSLLCCVAVMIGRRRR